MNATDDRQKECDYSLFEGEGMNKTFYIAVNQMRFQVQVERPYVFGLALDFGREGFRYEGNKELLDTLYCSAAAVFDVAVSLVGDILLYRFGATVGKLPRYLQELYRQAYDSAKVAYEESNSKFNAGVQFK